MMDASTDAQVAQIVELIANARSIAFLSGAGISTESGIADFRSPGGIWSKIKPIQYQDILSDEDIRLEDWRRRFHFQAEFDAAEPNDGHRAIAEILKGDSGLGLVTQNIDGLHQRSGLDEAQMIEIHGNGTRAACLTCESPMSLAEAKGIIEKSGRAPRCRRCDGLVKANVISFGQPMPVDKVVAATRMAQACDLFVVVGSSLVVQPVATLPVQAMQSGAKLLIINRDPTPLDSVADLVVHADLGATLGDVARKLAT